MADPVSVSYGKGAVSVYRIEGDRLFGAEIDLVIGDEVFVPSYTKGDNSLVVATDSMKNFIHTVALDYAGDTLEDLLREIATRFLDRYEHVEQATLTAKELAFEWRAGVVFQRLYDDSAWAWLESRRRDPRFLERSGRRGLHLVKLSGSSFAGFVRDEHTTLQESFDRPLFIHMDVSWENVDPERKRADGLALRDSFARTFADFESASIQHLVHEMGVRALDQFAELMSISFTAENRLWDTAQTAESATVYTDARPPYGLIDLTLER